MVNSKVITLGRNNVINALCLGEQVPTKHGDLMVKSKGAIDDTFMAKF